jgi:hypothetical protein
MRNMTDVMEGDKYFARTGTIENPKALLREMTAELERLRDVDEQRDRIAGTADQLRFHTVSIANSRVPNRHKASHGKTLALAGSAC